MREIKFRCWNPTNNRMIKIGDKSNDTALWIDENGFYVLDHFAGFRQPIADHLDGLILMQYVGLKDKNGVEIYEGDIVKHPKATAPEHLGWIIEWIGYAWLCKQVYPSGVSTRLHSYFSSCEVIGNIYEHPQLTEVK